MRIHNQVLGILLTLALALTMIPCAAEPVHAANVGTNAYGSTVTYTPVNSLYATYENKQSVDIQRGIMLFDATVSQWNSVPVDTRKYAAKAKTWLDTNQYLLNNFGRYNGAKTSKHWNANHPYHQFSGTIDSISGEHQYNVYYEFDSLRDGSAGGNITNMLKKDDIQYFFTTGIKTVQTSWAIFWKSNDWADLWFLDEHWKKNGDGWHDINWIGGAGPAFNDANAWKASSKIGQLHFKAESDRDKTINAYMGWGILVGRDVAGPRIQSVAVTADAEGKKPLSGAITLDTLKTLNNRTVYFQVTWDEPVLFAGLTSDQIAKLQLEVQTLGIDGTSGMPAKASLLKFAPAKTDSTPVMTFEYRIPDPYIDSSQVTQERGYYYKFSKIAVNSSDNQTIWHNLQDISGNKFAANRNGQQPSDKIEYSISGSPLVDLLPFAIHNIRTAKSAAPEKWFAQAGETYSVTLELNKTFSSSSAVSEITLNIQENGKNVKLAPFKTSTSNIKGAPGGRGSVLLYQLVLDPAKHTLDAADSVIRVTSLIPAENAKDNSGYTLMAYALNGNGALSPTNLPVAVKDKLEQYVKSPDKQYKLDFTPPNVSVDVSDKENGVIMVKATITDTNLEGSDAAFIITVDGKTDGTIQFQPSTSEAYDGGAWMKNAAAKNTQISFGAPIMGSGDTRYAYGFIKLPDTGTEVGGVTATVTAADEAGNPTTATGKLPPEGGTWDGVDSLPPVVTLEKILESEGAYAGKDEYARVTVADMSEASWTYVWQNTFAEDGTTRLDPPDLSTALPGNEGAAHFPEPGSLSDNQVYYRTLWVQATDSKGNTSEAVSMDYTFDRTFAEIIIKNADTETKYTGSRYPSVEVEINNVQKYWYAWVERPANYISAAGHDYGDLATYFKHQSGGMSSIGIHNFATEGMPGSDSSGAAEFFAPLGMVEGDTDSNPETGAPRVDSEDELEVSAAEGISAGEDKTPDEDMSADENRAAAADTAADENKAANENISADEKETADEDMFADEHEAVAADTSAGKNKAADRDISIDENGTADEDVSADGNEVGDEDVAADEKKPADEVAAADEKEPTGEEASADGDKDQAGGTEMNAGLQKSGAKLSAFGTSSLENTTNLTIALTGSTQVARHGDIGVYPYDPYDTKWAYRSVGNDTIAESIAAQETTRPVALLIWAQGEDGSLIYKAIEFDTFYKEPDSIEVRQERFSSNNNTGRRVDNTREIRDGGSPFGVPLGLYWPSDYAAPSYYGSKDAGAFFNLRSIQGFAEAQFYISGDPLSGLDRVDLEKSVITLQKVQYENLTDYSQTGELDWAHESNTTARQTLTEWKLSELAPRPAQDPRYIKDGESTWNTAYYHEQMGEHFSDFHTFTLNFDPALVEAVPFVFVGYNEHNGLPEYRNLRYEFKVKLAYKNGATGDESLLSYWIFDNGATGRAMLYGLMDNADGHYIRYGEIDGAPEEAQVAVVLDDDGNDITPNTPAITFGPWNGDDIEAARIQFAASEYPYSFGAEYRATQQSKYTFSPVPLGVGLKVRYGTEPDHLDSYALFEQSQSYEDNYMEYGAWGYTIPVSPGNFPGHGAKITLYYQFYDELQGGESPVYVVELRRDDEPPVIALSVSETTALQREVTVKLDAAYDIHVETVEGSTVYVIDTPASSLDFFMDAWRQIYPGEAFNTTDPDGEEYYNLEEDFWDTDYDDSNDHVRVKPDASGVYRFISKGYVVVNANDTAHNWADSLLVNGEAYTAPGEGHEGAVYIVGNIDRDPPEFTVEPKWTPEAATGSFALTATVDESAVAAYIRFDKDYAEFLTGVNYDAQTVMMEGDNPETEAVEDGYTITIPASEPPLYVIENVPGRFSGAFNPQTGEISLAAYVKYDGSGTAKLASATLIVEDSAGNTAEKQYNFSGGLGGVEPKISNATTGIPANVNNYPIYSYGGTLNFTAPVKLDDYKTGFDVSHGSLSLYGDGPAAISYSDLFGVNRTENVYADIFGPAFAHSLTFHVGETEISPTTLTNQDLTVKVDTRDTTGLTVGDGTATTWEITLSENGSITYSLTNNSVGQTKSFTLPVNNIDKTPPTPVVNAHINSAEKETVDAQTGEITMVTLFYSITYEICGFDKSDVAVIAADGSAAPSSVTFDQSSIEKIHTFRFRDAAGNEGEYTADVSDIAFSDPADAEIVGYRLTYEASGTQGTNRIGTYTGEGTLSISLTNSDVVVRAEVLNAAGEVVPATFAAGDGLPAGTVVFAPSKSVLFTGEDAEVRSIAVTLTGSRNAITFTLILPGGTIDKTAPIGTVYYAEIEGGGVKAYLAPLSADIPADGVAVNGQRSNGTALELKKDADRYYVEFDENGSGYFLLRDNAGNTGTVAISVQSIDNDPPGLGAEGWSADTEASSKAPTWAADLARILTTFTNNSIKVFFSFNEQLSRVEVTAYDRKDGSLLTPVDSYVTAIVSGSTVTIEFLQNCQANIVVYDLRGNQTILWRPEDGPITVIDKDAPVLEDGYPQKTVTGNKATLIYTFKNNEEIMLLSDPTGGYKNSHTVKFTDNGQYVLTFVDRAGNVLSVHPAIDELDVLAPAVKFYIDFIGEGKEHTGVDAVNQGFIYTSKQVRILLNVDDQTKTGLTVTAKRLGGAAVEVKQETVSQTVGAETKTYNYNVPVTENGVYEIIAQDQWGHENTFNINVNYIDKTAPTIKMESTKAISVERNTAADAVKLRVLQGVTATDAGAGRAEGSVILNADMSGVDLTKAGSYTVTITAADPLDNIATKTRTVNVRSAGVRLFLINGQIIEVNDVYVTTPETIKVDLSDASFGGEKATLYYARGYKSAAQMKYAQPFDGIAGFAASEKGYYTMMAQSAERGMYLVYVYVY